MGDKPAFDEVVRMCVPDLFRIAMSILRNKDDADDAVCETVVCAFEHLKTLKNCSNFKTWLTRILINQANAAFKNARKPSTSMKSSNLSMRTTTALRQMI